MAYEKQNFTPGQKLKASELNHMEAGIVAAVSTTEQSLTPEQKAQARNNIGIEGTGKDGYTPVKGIDYFDGNDGQPGKDGAPGKDGYTPVKGTDYYTEADKTEMVGLVLDALETWEGGSY